MALRIKEVEIGGTKYRIGNALVGPWADYTRLVGRIAKGEEVQPGETSDAMIAFTLSALKRADAAVTLEAVRALDGDDLRALCSASLAWFHGDAKPGEAASP